MENIRILFHNLALFFCDYLSFRLFELLLTSAVVSGFP